MARLASALAGLRLMRVHRRLRRLWLAVIAANALVAAIDVMGDVAR